MDRTRPPHRDLLFRDDEEHAESSMEELGKSASVAGARVIGAAASILLTPCFDNDASLLSSSKQAHEMMGKASACAGSSDAAEETRS